MPLEGNTRLKQGPDTLFPFDGQVNMLFDGWCIPAGPCRLACHVQHEAYKRSSKHTDTLFVTRNVEEEWGVTHLSKYQTKRSAW